MAATYENRDDFPIVVESLAIGDLAAAKTTKVTSFNDIRDVGDWPIQCKINIKDPISELRINYTKGGIDGIVVTYRTPKSSPTTVKKTHGNVHKSDNNSEKIIALAPNNIIVAVSGYYGKYDGNTGIISITVVRLNRKTGVFTVEGPFGYPDAKDVDGIKTFYTTGPIIAFAGRTDSDKGSNFSLRTLSFVTSATPVDEFGV